MTKNVISIIISVSLVAAIIWGFSMWLTPDIAWWQSLISAYVISIVCGYLIPTYIPRLIRGKGDRQD